MSNRTCLVFLAIGLLHNYLILQCEGKRQGHKRPTRRHSIRLSLSTNVFSNQMSASRKNDYLTVSSDESGINTTEVKKNTEGKTKGLHIRVPAEAFRGEFVLRQICHRRSVEEVIRLLLRGREKDPNIDKDRKMLRDRLFGRPKICKVQYKKDKKSRKRKRRNDRKRASRILDGKCRWAKTLTHLRRLERLKLNMEKKGCRDNTIGRIIRVLKNYKDGQLARRETLFVKRSLCTLQERFRKCMKEKRKQTT